MSLMNAMKCRSSTYSCFALNMKVLSYSPCFCNLTMKSYFKFVPIIGCSTMSRPAAKSGFSFEGSE